MTGAIQDKVLAATIVCLRPLARLLLRSGVNYRQFADAAKLAFLEEAASERDARGRTSNISRMAIRTGLSRKEIARIRDRRTLEKQTAAEIVREIRHVGHAARVLQLWYSDARFVDSSGEPKALRFNGDGITFSDLVRLVGGDIPAGAVRAELIAGGSIEETANGDLRAIKRHFVPGNINEDLVLGLAHIVHPVIEGLVRNTSGENVEPFVQRLAYSDRLLPAAVPLFRHIARSRCSSFVQSIDDWLSSNEIEAGSDSDESLRVGVGVFYFEGAVPSGAE